MDDSQFLQRIRQNSESHDLSITNIGRQPIPHRYGALTIEALYGGTGLPGEVVVCLCTLNDTLYVLLSTRGLSTEALIDQFGTGGARDIAESFVQRVLVPLRSAPAPERGSAAATAAA